MLHGVFGWADVRTSLPYIWAVQKRSAVEMAREKSILSRRVREGELEDAS